MTSLTERISIFVSSTRPTVLHGSRVCDDGRRRQLHHRLQQHRQGGRIAGLLPAIDDAVYYASQEALKDYTRAPVDNII